MRNHWSKSGKLISITNGVCGEFQYGDFGTVTIRPDGDNNFDIAVQFMDGSGLVAPFRDCTNPPEGSHIVWPDDNFSAGTWFMHLLWPEYNAENAYWINDVMTLFPSSSEDDWLESSAVIPGEWQTHDK